MGSRPHGPQLCRSPPAPHSLPLPSQDRQLAFLSPLSLPQTLTVHIAAAQRVLKSMLVTSHSHHTPASRTPRAQGPSWGSSCTGLCICIRVCACARVCMRVHVCVPVCVCPCVCMCVCVCVSSSVRVGLRDAGDTRSLALSGQRRTLEQLHSLAP